MNLVEITGIYDPVDQASNHDVDIAIYSLMHQSRYRWRSYSWMKGDAENADLRAVVEAKERHATWFCDFVDALVDKGHALDIWKMDPRLVDADIDNSQYNDFIKLSISSENPTSGLVGFLEEDPFDLLVFDGSRSDVLKKIELNSLSYAIVYYGMFLFSEFDFEGIVLTLADSSIFSELLHAT